MLARSFFVALDGLHPFLHPFGMSIFPETL